MFYRLIGLYSFKLFNSVIVYCRSDKREVTNDEITSLAKRLPAGKYSELCEKLGFDYNYVQNTLKKNSMDPMATFKEILQEWKNNGGYIEELDAALIEADLGGLVSKYKK